MCVYVIADLDIFDLAINTALHQDESITAKTGAIDQALQMLQRNVVGILIFWFEEFYVAAVAQAGCARVGLEIENVVYNILVAIDFKRRPFNREAAINATRLADPK